MKRRLLVISLLLTLSVLASAATKRALVVVIGDYPAQSGWNSLAGHNDKAIVLEMLEQNGFRPADIVCLEDASATYDGILAALQNLQKAARPGDQIYIHFSCHGQQITDLDGDEALRVPQDYLDEALVPYDAAIAYDWHGYKGEHHLTDDILSQHLSALQKAVGKQGRVLLVADACHSGDVQRAEDVEDAPFRGTFDTFKLPLTGRKSTPVSLEETWITISACKDFQTNFEVTVDSVRYGRLTCAICQVFKPGMTPEALREAIQREYQRHPLPSGKHQTVELKGPSNLMHKPVFK